MPNIQLNEFIRPGMKVKLARPTANNSSHNQYDTSEMFIVPLDCNTGDLSEDCYLVEDDPYEVLQVIEDIWDWDDNCESSDQYPVKLKADGFINWVGFRGRYWDKPSPSECDAIFGNKENTPLDAVLKPGNEVIIVQRIKDENDCYCKDCDDVNWIAVSPSYLEDRHALIRICNSLDFELFGSSVDDSTDTIEEIRGGIHDWKTMQDENRVVINLRHFGWVGFDSRFWDISKLLSRAEEPSSPVSCEQPKSSSPTIAELFPVGMPVQVIDRNENYENNRRTYLILPLSSPIKDSERLIRQSVKIERHDYSSKTTWDQIEDTLLYGKLDYPLFVEGWYVSADPHDWPELVEKYGWPESVTRRCEDKAIEDVTSKNLPTLQNLFPVGMLIDVIERKYPGCDDSAYVAVPQGYVLRPDEFHPKPNWDAIRIEDYITEDIPWDELGDWLLDLSRDYPLNTDWPCTVDPRDWPELIAKYGVPKMPAELPGRPNEKETKFEETAMYHTLQAGDTFWKLAKRYGTTVEAIAAANPELDPLNLQIGETICIPSGLVDTQENTIKESGFQVGDLVEFIEDGSKAIMNHCGKVGMISEVHEIEPITFRDGEEVKELGIPQHRPNYDGNYHVNHEAFKVVAEPKLHAETYQVDPEHKNTENKEGRVKSMSFKDILGPMGIDNSGNFKICGAGIAIKNQEGNYVYFDGEKTVDVMNAVMDADGMVFMLPCQKDSIRKNDLILYNKKPVYVIGVNPKTIDVFDPITDKEERIRPSSNLFGIKFYTKVVSMMDAMIPGKLPNEMAGILPLLMMSKKKDGTGAGGLGGLLGAGGGNKIENMMGIMMMSQFMGGGVNPFMAGGAGGQLSFNPMLMAMAGDNDDMLGLMMMGQFMANQAPANEEDKDTTNGDN